CGWILAQHFCNCLVPAYLSVRNVLDEPDPVGAEVLSDIKRRFREDSDTFTRESIAGVIPAYPESVGIPSFPPRVSLVIFLRLLRTRSCTTASAAVMVPNKHELQVFGELLDIQQVRVLLICTSPFNLSTHTQAHPFYQPKKVALSFRLAPDFLPEVEYLKKPFGMFVYLGNEFRGFHTPFRDVALSGIHIVMSPKRRFARSTNACYVFDENYGLAATLTLKNQDTLESAAKVTIL
ncbi:hypothetical protein DFH09DRAFT_835482, partial [Mycena vulgaris]